MNKRNLLRYVGNTGQLFGIKEYVLAGGRSKGVRAFDVRNGSGLEFTLLSDRCLDISALSLNGVNCGYLAQPGIVAPEFYEPENAGALRSFFLGFLSTCGLRNVGAPCEDNGEAFGLHGRISNIPAEEVCASTEWEGDVPVFSISGKMCEARFFGENLLLHRKISCRYGENKITIENRVENLGFNREPLQLLFHFNMGYPLLDEDAILVTPTKTLTPRDAEAAKGSADYQKFQAPTPNYAEQVFYHDLKTSENGDTCVALVNHRLEMGVALRFSKEQLTNFGQWKQPGQGEYVLGMEPSNCFVTGRADAREKGTLHYIDAGESKNFDITIEIVSGIDNLRAVENEILSLSR